MKVLHGASTRIMAFDNDESHCWIWSAASGVDHPKRIFDVLPDARFKKLMIKPNWVKHQEHPSFPIEALVTSSELIEAVIEACLEKYKEAQEITIGDVPLQSCQWDLLVQQAGIDKLINKYCQYHKPRIRFLDLRRERVNVRSGFIEKAGKEGFGDPKGYKEVQLDSSSFLEPISNGQNRFRVSDYDPGKTTSSHRRGFHRYLICGSVLGCDLFINVPKMKTHQKAGITGALKNLVGINGEKAYLVHYQQKDSSQGGDEFPPGIPWPIVLQTKVRELLQSRSKIPFRVAQSGWILLRKLYGIEVQGTRENLQKCFYSAGGSWYGNDSIWRMVYDLNKIVRYSPCEGGELTTCAQRAYIAIMDGIVAGEGNGPLQPLPVKIGRILAANDPFLMDTVMAQLVGFDWHKIPLLSRAKSFSDIHWGSFDAETVDVTLDGIKVAGIQNLTPLHRFAPPPGWKGHVELPIREDEPKTISIL